MHLDLEVGFAIPVNIARNDGCLGSGIVLHLELAGFVVKSLCAV